LKGIPRCRNCYAPAISKSWCHFLPRKAGQQLLVSKKSLFRQPFVHSTTSVPGNCRAATLISGFPFSFCRIGVPTFYILLSAWPGSFSANTNRRNKTPTRKGPTIMPPDAPITPNASIGCFLVTLTLLLIETWHGNRKESLLTGFRFLNCYSDSESWIPFPIKIQS
jgi:hypothetical protein